MRYFLLTFLLSLSLNLFGASNSQIIRAGAPLTLTNGTMSIPAASSSVDGYLSHNVYNSIQSSVTGPVSSTNTAIATYSGTGGNVLLDNPGATISSGVLTIANIIDQGLTASTACIANGSKNIVSSVTTSTELAFVHGVLSQLSGNADVATLSNKTLSAPVIATIVNSGTLTLPSSTDTLVGRVTTDTLTNKTLTAPVMTTPSFGSIVNSGTLTLPTSTDTLVGRATTDTLTNKTISNGTLSGTTATSLTANGVVISNGSQNLATVAPGTSGNVLTSSGGAWTSAAAGTGFASTTLSNVSSVAFPTNLLFSPTNTYTIGNDAGSAGVLTSAPSVIDSGRTNSPSMCFGENGNTSAMCMVRVGASPSTQIAFNWSGTNQIFFSTGIAQFGQNSGGFTFNVSGNLAFSPAGYEVVNAASTGSHTIKNNVSYFALHATGGTCTTLNSGTYALTMPAIPNDGQILTIGTDCAVGTLTISGNGGGQLTPINPWSGGAAFANRTAFIWEAGIGEWMPY